MARSITFSGITRFTPGGITRINAEALNQVLASDNSIVGLVGEAEGGAPGDVGGLVTIADPSRASDVFKSGPLVDAIRLAFQSSTDPVIPGGASKVYVWKTNSSTNSIVSLPSADTQETGVTITAGTSSTVTVGAAAWGVNAYAGHWVLVDDTTNTYLRKIVSNTATVLTVTPNFPVTPTGTLDIYANSIDVTSADWGKHTNGIAVDVAAGTLQGKVVTIGFEGDEEVSPDLGGNSIFHLLYTGGVASTTTTVHASPVAPNSTTQIELATGGLTPTNEVGKQVSIDGEYTVITANSATVLTVSPALSATPAAGSAVQIFDVEGGTAVVGGASGAATSLTTAFTSGGDTQVFAFVAGMTIRELMNTITLNTNYQAVAGQGVNPDTTYAADLDFGTTTFPILASPDISTGPTRDTVAVVDYLNNFAQWVNATRADSTTKAGGLAPSVTTDAVKLDGGTRGITINNDFQYGLDKLLTVRCNSVVPLIDQDLIKEGNNSLATVAAVAAQLGGHVAFARGAGQDTAGERGGFIGFRGNKTAIIKQANALNDMDVQITCQNPSAVNGLGNLQEFGPRMYAVMAASMRAGVQEVAEPLTHKAIRVSGVTQDSSWNPTDVADANEMIQNGVLFSESLDGVGTRWVRDITTWVADDNLAFSEGSVRDAVRFVAHGLRTTLAERFTGRKAKPATIGNVKDAASTYLETVRQDSIIVDSTDPATGVTVKAYHNLKVFASGDVLKINVGIFPVPGINFQLNDIYLQLPTQAA